MHLLERAAITCDRLGFSWIAPLLRLARGDRPSHQIRLFLLAVGTPLLAITAALLIWLALATQVRIGNLAIPGPTAVWDRGVEMVVEWQDERRRAAEHEAMIAKAVADGLTQAEARQMLNFTEKSTFASQVLLSLRTVFTGVFMAVLIAVPLGILCGLFKWAHALSDPLVQLLKPVSPLAWFPVVYIVMNALITTPSQSGDWFPKSFIIAACVVCLCAMWPTLISTANGVANVERDHLNVARVLNLGFFARIRFVILPAALPHICTGIRLSLGIGWMVLIAAEMMAVSPGLGGFIWNWYQSSNETALSYLLLSVIVIGMIGFALDRAMIIVQRMISHGAAAQIR
ncbi:nitrate ABC transporter permease [Planctomycetota bacterium]|nr:nitrate ABC transporter permease [Planctomycetota bacterium]